MKPIETRYARSGDVRIAYQVAGHGSLDLVLIPSFLSNLELQAEEPGYAQLLRRLSTFARVIQFDKRGTGLSDRVDPRDRPDLQTRMDDVRAVMDAAGSGRAVLLGAGEGAAIAILFALAWPQRLKSLVLYGGYAHFGRWAMAPERLTAFLESIVQAWGSGSTLALLAPGRAQDGRLRDWWARFERLSASPGAAIALTRMNAAIDICDRVAEIRAPTLVVHRKDDAWVNAEASRYLAANIPGAQLVELPGRDHPLWLGDVDGTADAVEAFLTGGWPSRRGDRVLAAVLAARIVGHERLAARIADREWRDRIEGLKQAFAPSLRRANGRMIAADSGRLVLWFDGPAKAADAARALCDAAMALQLPLAQGLHVGEIEMEGDAVTGLALQVAGEIASHAGSGEILVSAIAAELSAGSGLHFVNARSVSLAGSALPVRLVSLAAERHLEPVVKRTKAAGLDVLSGREREVLARVAEGLSNASIAGEFGLSEHTVKRHVANILLKLDLPSRAAAAALSAREHVG